MAHILYEIIVSYYFKVSHANITYNMCSLTYFTEATIWI